MVKKPARYRDGSSIYHADTCEPVKEAVRKKEMKMGAIAKGSYPGDIVPDTFLPGVVSMGYWDVEFDQTWKLDWHRNEGIEFVLLDQGQINFAIEDKKFNLQPTQLTVARPWQKHNLGDPFVTTCRLHWIIIDVGVRQPHTDWKWPKWIVLSKKELNELTEMLRGNETPVWQSTSKINKCFVDLKKEMDAIDMEDSETRFKLMINELFLAIHSLFKSSSQPLNSSFTTARRTVQLFLEDLPNHLDIDWTLANMAKHCYMGRTQFSTLCTEITNHTPMKYLIRCRIAKAEALLKNPAFSITDILFKCGFSSSQYFSSQFKKVKGMSPREDRKKL